MSVAPSEIFGQAFADMIRLIIREELSALRGHQEVGLLTPQQVKVMLGFKSVHSVYALKREGKLKAVMVGLRSYKFAREEVERFIREGAA